MDYINLYNDKTTAEMRKLLEQEFRKQYEIACTNSTAVWQGKFKKAFEDVVESLHNLDTLL